MANERIPNEPYRASDPYRSSDPYRVSNPADDPYRTNRRSEDIGSPARFENELQMDPELAEGPAGGSRIALFAVGIAVILGAVFYGLNNSSIKEANTPPPATTAQNTGPTSPPAAPPGMRDVTPHANSTPGMTTGAATPPPKSPTPKALDPKNPPAPSPSGGTE